jgi:hypothetical protein
MQPSIRLTPSWRIPWFHAAAAIGVLLLTVAACAGGSAGLPADAGRNGNGDAAVSAAEEAAGGKGQTSRGPLADLADLAERKIVKTGEITLAVASVGSSVGEVRAMALTLGGYVGASSAGSEGEAATLNLRIPADRFEDALSRLRAMDGDVRAEATKEQDVTSSIVDLEARIRNLEVSEAQYRLLVQRAQKVNDILAVQSRLDDVRGQIEQLKAQREQLSGLAALSTLTVTLVPSTTPVEDVAEGWHPGATFDHALAALVGLGQGISDLLIWLAIVGLPIGIVGAVGLVLVLRVTPAVRRRSPSAPGAEE